MIEVRNLVKRYGDHLAVDHLNFALEKGKVYGFLGPNGAGKSTTMNMMTGYLSATEGEILIQGHDILKEPKEAKKYIGYLPELPPLYMEMTVREYLDFAAELVGIRKQDREDQVENVMDLVKVEKVQDRLIRNLSKGYRQRVGLAQALLGYPEILILDEPMVGMDPQQIIEVRELIRELAKEHTVILSSHILAEVSEICDEILIISRGKLVASGTPEELERMMQGGENLKILARCEKEEAEEILNCSECEKFYLQSGKRRGNGSGLSRSAGRKGYPGRGFLGFRPCRETASSDGSFRKNAGRCVPAGDRRGGITG